MMSRLDPATLVKMARCWLSNATETAVATGMVVGTRVAIGTTTITIGETVIAVATEIPSIAVLAMAITTTATVEFLITAISVAVMATAMGEAESASAISVYGGERELTMKRFSVVACSIFVCLRYSGHAQVTVGDTNARD